MTSNAIGLVIGDVFALAWWCAAASTSRNPRILFGIGTLAAAAIAAMPLILISKKGVAHSFNGITYGVVVAFEIASIVLCVYVLRRQGRADFIAPAVAFIVGLHFLGLWAACPLVTFVINAVGLMLSGSIAAFVRVTSEKAVTRRLALTGFLSAGVLWMSCVLSAVT